MHRHHACLTCLAAATATFAASASLAADKLPRHAPAPTLERPVTLPEATNVLPAARPGDTSADQAKPHWVPVKLA
jgi:hypothetical protein